MSITCQHQIIKILSELKWPLEVVGNLEVSHSTPSQKLHSTHNNDRFCWANFITQ